MTIIGIDPGTATTGYGVIKKVQKRQKTKNQNELKCLEYGVIKTSPAALAEKRLEKLYLEISKLLRKYKPKIMAIESLYFFKNLKTVMPVSEAKELFSWLQLEKK